MEYSKIQSLPTASAKQHEVEQQLSGSDYVSITDALSNIGRGGEYVLQLLADEQQSSFRGAGQMRSWKIKAMLDKWGTPYKPGDVVSWEVAKSIRVNGKKLNARQVKDMKRRGDDDKLYDVHQYTVDSDGMIECGYNDACHLINQFGVHYETGVAVTSRREKGREPTTRPDGTTATQHFWRFKEVPPGFGPLNKAGREPEKKTEAPEPKAETFKNKRGRKPGPKPKALEKSTMGDLEDGK